MAAKRAYISFDTDHNEDLRPLINAQSKNPDSPFTIHNWSVKVQMIGDWTKNIRHLIRQSDLTIVICGEHTHKAPEVSAELSISREEGKPYILLCGRPDKICRKPLSATPSDMIYEWTWDKLKSLIAEPPESSPDGITTRSLR